MEAGSMTNDHRYAVPRGKPIQLYAPPAKPWDHSKST